MGYLVAVSNATLPVAWQREGQRHALGQADFAVSNVKGPGGGVRDIRKRI
jgi:hypothetical protein